MSPSPWVMRLGDITILHVHLGQDLDMAFHALHPRLHVSVDGLPFTQLSLELFDPNACLVTRGRRTLAVALLTLVLTPGRELLLRHGG